MAAHPGFKPGLPNTKNSCAVNYTNGHCVRLVGFEPTCNQAKVSTRYQREPIQTVGVASPGVEPDPLGLQSSVTSTYTKKPRPSANICAWPTASRQIDRELSVRQTEHVFSYDDMIPHYAKCVKEPVPYLKSR